jgi:hypothetical protein
MVDIQKIIERKKLRIQILEELYELFFSGGPEAFSSGRLEALLGTQDELFTSNERHKAFHYLQGKKLIEISPSGKELLAIYITSDGIDYFESEVSSQ